jgi:hypothetical protein
MKDEIPSLVSLALQPWSSFRPVAARLQLEVEALAGGDFRLTQAKSVAPARRTG